RVFESLTPHQRIQEKPEACFRLFSFPRALRLRAVGMAAGFLIRGFSPIPLRPLSRLNRIRAHCGT
ncbi:hypothetical protein, partial [Cupriavidus sp. SK-4]|uniref:hypothetical protein n=1 Tax=Cupriavidus sp. SK-4 TaxID=574750 RepID=UPI001F47C29D